MTELEQVLGGRWPPATWSTVTTEIEFSGPASTATTGTSAGSSETAAAAGSAADHDDPVDALLAQPVDGAAGRAVVERLQRGHRDEYPCS